MSDKVLILAYGACQTCKKAIKWLEERGVSHTVRPIVDEPPTARELAEWIAASGLPVRKWLNTSGQSYRAIGKDAALAASDQELITWLSRDGKLVKRPVLVRGRHVLVGFRPEAYASLFTRS